MDEITQHSIIQRNEDNYLFTEVDGETVLMHTTSGAYFGMNKQATSIWNLIKERTQIEHLVNKLVEQFDVDRETCLQESMDLLRVLYNRNMLLVSLAS